MSKCWYCNNELTSGDSPKHFGICNKCYDGMFKSSDTIVRSLTDKIAELQKQLEEKEKTIQGLIEAQKYLEESASYQMFLDIQKQLEEKEKKIRQLDNEKGMLLNNYMKLLKEKDDKLKSQPKEIVEKIKEFVDGNAYYYEEEQYAKHIIKYLDDILKEYQK